MVERIKSYIDFTGQYKNQANALIASKNVHYVLI